MIKYLNKILCHHPEEELSHCIKIKLFKKELLLCSRCSGLYPFAIVLLVLSLKYNVLFSYKIEKNILIYLFFPAFVDWSFTSLNIIKSNNIIRFITGIIASFPLSRIWFLIIKGYYQFLIIKILLIYGVSIIFILFLSYRNKKLREYN